MALGQPIATFGGDDKKATVISDKCATKGAKDKSADKKDIAIKEKEQKANSQIIASNCQQQSYPKRSKVNLNIITSSLPVVSPRFYHHE